MERGPDYKASRKVREVLVVELFGRNYPLKAADTPTLPEILGRFPERLYERLPFSSLPAHERADIATISRVRRESFDRLAEMRAEIAGFAESLCRCTTRVFGGRDDAERAKVRVKE